MNVESEVGFKDVESFGVGMAIYSMNNQMGGEKEVCLNENIFSMISPPAIYI